MRSPEVMDEDIIAAGEYMRLTGRPVTGWTLRKALGDRGNSNRLMRIWQRHLGVATAAESQPAQLPESVAHATAHLRDTIDHLMTGMYQAALQQARTEVGKDLAAVREELDEAHSALDVADRRVNDLAADLDASKASEQRAREDAAAAHAGAQVALDQARVREEETDRLRTAHADLTARLAAAQAEIDGLKGMVATANHREALLDDRLQKALADAATAAGEAAKVSGAGGIIKAEADRAWGELASARTDLAAVRSELESLKRYVGSAESRALEAEDERQRLEDEVTTLRTELAAARRAIAERLEDGPISAPGRGGRRGR